MRYASWTVEDWSRHYAGPRWNGRAEPGSVWDEQGRPVPGEMVRCGGGIRQVLLPADVRDAKADLDARWAKLYGEVSACQLMDQAERVTFEHDAAAWRSFFCGGVADDRQDPHVEPVGLVGQMNDVDRHEHALAVWRHRLAERLQAGDTEQERKEKVQRPILMLAAIAGAFYFLGPSLRRELWAPVTIRRDLVEKRRQVARDMGEDDVEIHTEPIGADLAAQVADAIGVKAAGPLPLTDKPAQHVADQAAKQEQEP